MTPDSASDPKSREDELPECWRVVVENVKRNMQAVYMPVGILALCDLVEEERVKDRRVPFTAYEDAWRGLMNNVAPAKRDNAWEPFYHLSTNGLWSLYRGGKEVPPFTNPRDDRPKSRSRLLDIADEARVAPPCWAVLSRAEGRDKVRHAAYDMLSGRSSQKAQRVVTAHRARRTNKLYDEALLDEIARSDEDLDDDLRMRTLQAIVLRQGQRAFRQALLDAYDGRCAMTDCRVEEALEAAHIDPYLGEHTHRVDNGLLLRADVHTLFDRGLVSVDPNDYQILVAPQLYATEYAALSRKKLKLPSSQRPSMEALARHKERSGL